MMGKIGLVITGTVLAMFVMGRVESLAAHRGFGGSTAWAQNWDDPADDAGVDSQPATVPDVSGSYSGPVEDHRFGSGTIAVEISQGGPSGGKLSGPWETDLNGGAVGTLKGKVKPNNKVAMKLKITGKGSCGLNAHGIFENGNEISGVYHTTGCGHPDHGTFDIFR
jgi:hypothetical protein